MAGAGTSAYPEASSDHKTPKEPDALFSLVADPEGVRVSVRSSSDWEAVTMPDATFLGIDLVAYATYDGVAVLGVKYSRSCLSSKPINSWADGVTNFERPCV